MKKATRTIFQLVCLALTFASNTSNADLVKTRIVADNMVPISGFHTPDAAAIAASNRYNPDSIEKNREHVGGIVRCNRSEYFYTHGRGESGVVPVQFSVAYPKSCKLHSFWHTHGGSFEDRKFFSPADTHTANSADKPFFMSDYQGNLRVYRPGGRLFSSNKRTRGRMTPFP
jgi:hypothetical protein